MTDKNNNIIEQNQIKPIELKFELSDFGPISEGKVYLKPLTLFIGPNNAGKSYVAMLIDSIFQSLPVVPPTKLNKARHNEFIKKIEEMQEQEEINVPENIINNIIEYILNLCYETMLNNEIIRAYASELEELIRLGKDLFKFKLLCNSYEIPLEYNKEQLKIKSFPSLNKSIKIKFIRFDLGPGHIPVEQKDDEFIIVLPDNSYSDRAYLKIYNICFFEILRHLKATCYYLPADRSGILQSHKALSAIIVRQAPLIGTHYFDFPKLSGVVSDFISTLITLPEKPGPFFNLATEFENELINGKIVLKKRDTGYSEIKYSFEDQEIPLHRSSSTVSEMAPLFLYMKYLLKPGNVLIIEEPESHLHPANQRILAKYLVRLIRAGAYITITTHSEFLIEQFNSFLFLSKIDKKKRTHKYHYKSNDFLNTNEIGAYVFEPDNKLGGYKINNIQITEEDGISQEEYLKIHEALYEEQYKLINESNN